MPLPDNYTPPWGGLLTLKEVCKVLQCGRNRVLGLHHRGILKGVKVGFRLMWTLRDVELYIENQRMKAGMIVELCKNFTPAFTRKRGERVG